MPARLFKRVGIAYDVAEDGLEAVDLVLVQKRSYCAVIIDNQMPRMRGAAATRALRLGGYNGKIIGMTGDPRGCPERDEFEASGLDIVVDKTTAGIDIAAELLRAEAE